MVDNWRRLLIAMFYLFQVSPNGFFIKRVRQKQGKCLITLLTRRNMHDRFQLFFNGVSHPYLTFHLAIFSPIVLVNHSISLKNKANTVFFLGFLLLHVLTDSLRTVTILLTLSSQQQYQSRLRYTFSCSYCLHSNPIFRVQTALDAAGGEKTDKPTSSGFRWHTRESSASGNYLLDSAAFFNRWKWTRDHMIRSHTLEAQNAIAREHGWRDAVAYDATRSPSFSRSLGVSSNESCLHGRTRETRLCH